MEIRDHPGKRQMVAVTADGPTSHTMSLAPEQQEPANSASTIPPAMVADELPAASERKPQPTMIPITTRSGCLVKPIPRLINLMMSELVSSTKRQMNIKGELLSFAAMSHEPEEMHNPILAYKAVNPDILRLHEAIQAKDQKEFKAAMEKEVNDQIDKSNFSIIPQSKVPMGFRVFPGVWTLVCKQDILTREIKKYKAHLAFDGSRTRMRRLRQNLCTCGIVDVDPSSFDFRCGFWMAYPTSGLCHHIHPSSHRPKHVHGVSTWIQSSWQCRQKRHCLETPP